MTLSAKTKHWLINSRLLGRIPDTIKTFDIEEINLWNDDSLIPTNSQGWFIDLLIETELNESGNIHISNEIRFLNFTYEDMIDNRTKLNSITIDFFQKQLEDFF